MNTKSIIYFYKEVDTWPASMAQLDAQLTGDQEVAGSTPIGSATFFRRDLIMKYFLQSFSPFCCCKKGNYQFLAKECAQY